MKIQTKNIALVSAAKITDEAITIMHQETAKGNVPYGTLWSTAISIILFCEKNRTLRHLMYQAQM